MVYGVSCLVLDRPHWPKLRCASMCRARLNLFYQEWFNGEGGNNSGYDGGEHM